MATARFVLGLSAQPSPQLQGNERSSYTRPDNLACAAASANKLPAQDADGRVVQANHLLVAGQDHHHTHVSKGELIAAYPGTAAALELCLQIIQMNSHSLGRPIEDAGNRLQ